MRVDVGLETRREHDQAALSNATMSDERPAAALLRRAWGHAPRFLKYGTVGASGVLVNMGCLFLLADAIGIHTNLAALLAIECSVLNNFMWNEVWTGDRWVPLDATLGRGGIGAAHLKLADSNLKGASGFGTFLPVAQVMGQLEVELAEVD